MTERKPIDAAAAVQALDAIDASGDCEGPHFDADEILLAVVPRDVAAAYDRLIERANWWAHA